MVRERPLRPINILTPKNYRERSAEDLFAHELRQSRALYNVASVAGRLATGSLEIDDPDDILINYANGPCVIVSNHHDYFDIPIIGNTMRSKYLPDPYYVAMADLFGVEEGDKSMLHRIKRRSLGFIVGHLGGFPLDRYRAMNDGQKFAELKKIRAMSRHVLTVLKRPLVVFPEGGFSSGSLIGPIGTGAINMARDSGVPVVVTAIAGTEGATRQLAHARRPKVVVHVHEAILPDSPKPKSDYLGIAMQDAANVAYELRDAS